MERQFVVLALVMSCFCVTVRTNCLTVLDSDNCYQIQVSGQKIAQDLKQIDSEMQLVLFRCIEEAELILKSTIGFLKTQLPGVKVVPPKTSPIESSALYSTEKSSHAVATQMLKQSNYDMMSIMSKAAKLALHSDIIAKALLHVPGKAPNSRGKRDTGPSVNSIDGAVQSLLPEVKQVLVNIDTTMKGEAKKIFDMFTASFEALLGAKTHIKFNEAKVKLEKYLHSTAGNIITSILEQCREILLELVKQFEIIHTKTAAIQKDNTKLSKALEPAAKLIDEVLETTVQSRDDSNVKHKITSLTTGLRQCYLDIKKLVS